MHNNQHKDRPYNQQIDNTVIIRTFSQDIDESELVWHRDKKDRKVTIVGQTDWQFQFDNQLPQVLKNVIFIPKDTYHRVIKGTGQLKIHIEEL